MRAVAVLWTWIQSYSADVLRGEQSGGQRDIRLGRRIGLDLGNFFNGGRHSSTRRRYRFAVEPYAGIPAWPMTLGLNPATGQRRNEVRLVRQDPRSAEAYPLWPDIIEKVPSNRRALQCILLFRDVRGRLHLRCIGSGRSLHVLPKELREQMSESLRAPGAPSGVWLPRQPTTIAAEIVSAPPRTPTGRAPSWVYAPRNWKELRRRGVLGERHVLDLLTARYPEPRYVVEHVASADPLSDHDLRVLQLKPRRVVLYVEVKATAGRVGSPVRISGREVAFLRRHRNRHRVFIVYLRAGGRLPPVRVVEATFDAMKLVESEYFLWPDCSPSSTAP
jgi:hypothetical protein